MEPNPIGLGESARNARATQGPRRSQWSRIRSDSESHIDRVAPYRAREGLNGAESDRTRRVGKNKHGVFTDEEASQWSRIRSDSERGSASTRTLHGQRVSMEPNPIGLGETAVAMRFDMPDTDVSMEPNPIGLGEKTPVAWRSIIAGVSMEPNPIGLGEVTDGTRNACSFLVSMEPNPIGLGERESCRSSVFTPITVSMEPNPIGLGEHDRRAKRRGDHVGVSMEPNPIGLGEISTFGRRAITMAWSQWSRIRSDSERRTTRPPCSSASSVSMEPNPIGLGETKSGTGQYLRVECLNGAESDRTRRDSLSHGVPAAVKASQWSRIRSDSESGRANLGRLLHEVSQWSRIRSDSERGPRHRPRALSEVSMEPNPIGLGEQT